ASYMSAARTPAPVHFRERQDNDLNPSESRLPGSTIRFKRLSRASSRALANSHSHAHTHAHTNTLSHAHTHSPTTRASRAFFEGIVCAAHLRNGGDVVAKARFRARESRAGIWLTGAE